MRDGVRGAVFWPYSSFPPCPPTFILLPPKQQLGSLLPSHHTLDQVGATRDTGLGKGRGLGCLLEGVDLLIWEDKVGIGWSIRGTFTPHLLCGGRAEAQGLQP